MTLYRQIVLMTLLLFTLLLVAVLSLQFTHTRDYLARQMQTDVQNTVTSLGLSLLPHLETGDQAAAESVVSVVFDGGYYREITLELAKENARVQRETERAVVGVPGWFTALELFEPVTEANVLTSGWLQLGTLQVTGHPGYAYQQLWQFVSGLLSWFVAAFFLVAVALVYGLRYLLRPLGLLQQRAQAIENQQFGEPLPEPRIRELKGLIKAFNSMSRRLESLFETQAREAERLRREAHLDPVTGVANRHFFNLQLQQWLAEPGDGGLAMIGTQGLQQLQAEGGYQARDRLIREQVEVIQRHLERHPGALLARLSKSDLALILPGLDAEQVASMVNQVVGEIQSNLALSGADQQVRCSGGVVLRRPGDSAGQLLSQVDLALQQARKDPNRRVQVVCGDPQLPVLGRDQWRQLALSAMDDKAFFFQRQPVLALADNRLLALEVFTGIEREGRRYHAGQYMPFVDQFGLGGRFDRCVLQALASPIANLSQPLTLNLSESAIADAAFSSWLHEYLAALGESRRYLSFDLPEEALIRDPESLQALTAMLSASGVRFGFDRLGLHFERLRELAAMGPAYFKLDSGLVLDEDSHSAGFYKALAGMARTQEIDLILTRIEDAQQLEQLRALPVDGYQGYIVPPEAWLLSAEGR
ncbi:LapD/MoxY N-terminal periplasmic domain-containing protein [Motiliproteus sp. SC1-56]|uniref:bifunctional diguanylate cyclase/phosphodiesterase n=1 Tax=Motiliproteus sp. SC1-56 TaxID=2799565 RepID=UPI001A8E5312|nr:LapD/MoxY N-terminal periplasmic domain-containing protein [Motiliproteus sp. SC1-56]